MSESTRQRLAFDLYVRLGPGRSIEELQRQMRGGSGEWGRSVPHIRTLYEWSRRYLWQERLLDLEREARQQDHRRQIEALAKMSERHIKEGVTLQQKGVHKLMQVAPEDLSVEQAIRAVVEGVKLERLGMGQPTERIHTDKEDKDDDQRLRHLSLEELRRLAALAEGFAEGDSAPEPG